MLTDAYMLPSHHEHYLSLHARIEEGGADEVCHAETSSSEDDVHENPKLIMSPSSYLVFEALDAYS